ncbi:MAG: VOC family protein [Clostridiales bacterium]|nr:VOC family protein [Clostridiales bacterium]
MLRLSSTYVVVRDMERSVEFYSLLFDMEPSARVLDRWAQFDVDGGCFGVFNQMFDYKVLIAEKSTDVMFNKAYVDRLSRHNTVFGNNVIHHFRVDELSIEYDRLLSLKIGQLSDILFVNVSFPYHFFTLTDPDGNIIEITGEYAGAGADEAKSDKSSKIETDDSGAPSGKSSKTSTSEAPQIEKPEVEVSVEPVKLQKVKKTPPPEEEAPDKESIEPEEEPPSEKSVKPQKEPSEKESGKPQKEPTAKESIKAEEETPLLKAIKSQKEQPATDSINADEDIPFKTFLKTKDFSMTARSSEPESDSVDLLDESVVVQPEREVSIEEIRYAVQEESSSMPAETFIDHSIIRAAIQKERERQIKERERQIREQANGIPIFKPIEPEPEPEPEESSVEPLEKASDPEKSDDSKRAPREKPEQKRPIWEEPAKDLWRDE